MYEVRKKVFFKKKKARNFEIILKWIFVHNFVTEMLFHLKEKKEREREEKKGFKIKL